MRKNFKTTPILIAALSIATVSCERIDMEPSSSSQVATSSSDATYTSSLYTYNPDMTPITTATHNQDVTLVWQQRITALPSSSIPQAYDANVTIYKPEITKEVRPGVFKVLSPTYEYEFANSVIYNSNSFQVGGWPVDGLTISLASAQGFPVGYTSIPPGTYTVTVTANPVNNQVASLIFGQRLDDTAFTTCVGTLKIQ